MTIRNSLPPIGVRPRIENKIAFEFLKARGVVPSDVFNLGVIAVAALAQAEANGSEFVEMRLRLPLEMIDQALKGDPDAQRQLGEYVSKLTCRQLPKEGKGA